MIHSVYFCGCYITRSGSLERADFFPQPISHGLRISEQESHRLVSVTFIVLHAFLSHISGDISFSFPAKRKSDGALLTRWVHGQRCWRIRVRRIFRPDGLTLRRHRHSQVWQGRLGLRGCLWIGLFILHAYPEVYPISLPTGQSGRISTRRRIGFRIGRW